MCNEFLSARVKRNLDGKFISVSSIDYGDDPNWAYVKLNWKSDNKIILERNDFLEILNYESNSWEQIFSKKK